MFRLASLLYTLIASSLAGTGVIIVLVAGYGTLMPILVSAAIGAILALPISWMVARRLYEGSVTR
ncbi:MAG: CTP synthetase [Sedimentitalea sp.]|nr:CTP synthetase [Sedimentitalea sp.]